MAAMFRRLLALLGALLIPYLIFVFAIALNESDTDRDELADRAVNFDVEDRQQKVEKQETEPPKRERQRRPSPDMPSIKPTDIGSSMADTGLSFGVPAFDEAEFDEIAEGDTDLLDADDDQAMDKGSVDTPPKVKRRSPIVYPELARKQGITGHVVMSVLINESGNVQDVEIIESEPEEIFDLKATNTIRRWKFEPATYDGKKVSVWATQKIVFKLD